MFLCSDQMLLRGDDARSIQLADMFMDVATGVGPDSMSMLCFIIDQGKTNRVGLQARRRGWEHGYWVAGRGTPQR